MLSLVMPYYRNPRMLMRHLLVWKYDWPSALHDRVQVVLVDDGSPEETAASVLAEMWNGDRTGLPSVALYRVKEDRLWHQHGARNLGAHVAKESWLLMTDIDHIVPASTLIDVLRLLPHLQSHEVLTFGRVDAPASLNWRTDCWPEFARTLNQDGARKPHVNSFAIAREQYWKIGGYDEAFCGIYGTDQEFRTRLWKQSVERHLENVPLIRVSREVIPDASTRNVERKTPGRNAAKQAVWARKSETLKTLQFPWERVPL